MERRAFLATLGAALTASALDVSVLDARRSQPARTRLILLGTGGGPRPRKSAAASAQAIVAGGRLYVVDCGDGIARQLASANLALDTLANVFITHHHSDHNADYGNLLLLAWAVGLRTRVDTWGPPPIEQITRSFFEMSAYDIDVRMRDEQHPPLIPLIHAHDVKSAGVVMKDANVTVTCAIVDHPLVTPALAYRFDAPDRSIVISGDTAPSDNLIKLARNADVLVHEAFLPSAVDRIAARLPSAAQLKRHIVESHTSAEDCGRIAAAAGVKTLVLSHLVPPDDPLVTEQMWLDAARTHFNGRVVLGRDLMEI